MVKQGIEKGNQIALFRMIQKALPPSLSLVNVISEILEISLNAAYCRIRGDKPLYFEEVIRLCRRFRISLDSLIGVVDKNRIQCGYSPLDTDDPAHCLSLMREVSAMLENAAGTPQNELFVLAPTGIPAFNVFAYTELSVFRYFSWSNLFGCTESCYEKFVEEPVSDEMTNYNRKMLESYRRIPSTEIWTDNTIGMILQFLGYHFEMGHFNNTGSVQILCRKLLDALDTLERWATDGVKGPDGAAFKLYLSRIDIGNTLMLFKSAEKPVCWLKLFTMHGLIVSDEKLCSEVENWMKHSIQRSTLISGTSAIERHRFFESQRQKIDSFMTKVTVS